MMCVLFSGYMAPEYVMHGQISMKSDVYSFGVLVLEIVSGKMNIRCNETDGSVDSLVTHVSISSWFSFITMIKFYGVYYGLLDYIYDLMIQIIY